MSLLGRLKKLKKKKERNGGRLFLKLLQEIKDMYLFTVELQGLEHIWNHGDRRRLEVVSVNHSARSGGKKGYLLDFL